MRVIEVAAGLAIATASAGFAGAGEHLSMSKAVCTALANNSEIQSAQFASEAASEQARQARAHRLPSVDVSEVFHRSDNPAETFALLLNQGRFDAEEFFESDPNNPDPLTTWISRIEVVQPVYTGGKLSARIDQAGLFSEAENLRARHTRQRAIHDTLTAYTNLAKAREYLGLLESSRETTARHVELAEQYADEGMLVEAELLKARVRLAYMDELVQEARNRADLGLAGLNFQMGIDQNIPHALAALPSPPEIAGELDEWIVHGVAGRGDLESARRKLDAGRLEDKVARAGFLPEVAVIGRLDWYDDRIFGTHGDSATILGVAKINVFRGGADSAARAIARHRTRSFEFDMQRFEEGVRLEIRQAWQDLATARARLATSAAVVGAADEALRVRDERFRQGLDKMIDLLDAEAELREVRIRELVARYDVALATYRLLFASGQPLTDLTTLSEECS